MPALPYPPIDAALQAAARQALRAALAAGPNPYAGVIVDRACVAAVARRLRAERRRGRAGHWTYDFNRHLALRQTYETGRQALDTAAERGPQNAEARHEAGLSFE